MIINDYKYKVSWCPVCNQGWVEIVKLIETNQLLCCCGECDSQWSTPDNINLMNVVNIQGLVCEPNYYEIDQKGWTQYIDRID